MVKRSNTSILPRVTQHLTSSQESAIGQESRLLKSSLMLNPVKLDTLKPRLISFFISTLTFSLFTYFILAIISYLRLKVFLSVENLIFFFFTLLVFSFFSGIVYKWILGVQNASLTIYASVYAYSMIYLPIPMILTNFIKDIGFIFFFAVAMVSQYWIGVVLTQGVVFVNSKDKFLFHLAVFILQFSGIFLLNGVVQQG